MSKYGEPWVDSGVGGIVLHGSSKARAYACVNALAGIDDPAALLREVREVLEECRAARTCPVCNHHRGFCDDSCRLAALLAKMKGGQP